MRTEQFNNELRNLSAMVNTWDADELFVVSYKDLLAKVKADEDRARRQQHAQRMRKLLMLQAQFLMNAWLEAKREEEARFIQ